ncbi:MAG: methyltransferase domain-containing protein [Proteobacteria bacterium]|nr:methyltransferase domain-containing protein [Pseudomonadota bacterium]
MANDDKSPAADLWSNWLLHGRDAGDPELRETVRTRVDGYVDRLLEGAHLAPGETLADIGSGEGHVAFRAIERVGPTLRVCLSDVSEPMLRHAEARAVERGVRGQCTFVRCAADRLEGMNDASADVVTTRSVLAYVQDKTAALREFHRILKAGGRISLAEPVMQDDALAARAMKAVIDSKPPEGVSALMVLLHRWKAAQYPDTEEKIRLSPLANYSERDLVRFAQNAGFLDIHLELHIDIVPSILHSWEAFINSSPHPLAPPLSAIMAEQFTPAERDLFERSMRPVLEDPKSVSTDRMLYLTARKPPA